LSANARSQLVEFWRNELQRAPRDFALVTDYPRPPRRSLAGATRAIVLPAATSSAVFLAAREAKTTPFTVLLAAFKVLCSLRTGRDDIVVGAPVTNRPEAELEGIIGYFVNTLALYTDISNCFDFRAVLQKVDRTTRAAYLHRDLPFEFEDLLDELRVPRQPLRHPLFQLFFVFDSTPAIAFEHPALTWSPYSIPDTSAKFDLEVLVRGTEGELIVSMNYMTTLFHERSIDRLLDHFQVLLSVVAGDPDRNLVDLARELNRTPVYPLTESLPADEFRFGDKEPPGV
jgi:non-ribosomal peptide synthetase component F